MTTSTPEPVRRQLYADATGLVIAAVRHSASGGKGTPPAVAFSSPEQIVLALGIAAGIIESCWTERAAEHGVPFDEYLAMIGAANATLS